MTGRSSDSSAVGGPVQGLLNIDLARHIRDKLPINSREDFVEIESFLSSEDSDAHHNQFKSFIVRGVFGTSEKEFINSILLRIFSKKFANCSISWAGTKKTRSLL